MPVALVSLGRAEVVKGHLNNGKFLRDSDFSKFVTIKKETMH